MIDNRQIKRLSSPFFFLVLIVLIVFIASSLSLQRNIFDTTEISRAFHVDTLFTRFPLSSRQDEPPEPLSKPPDCVTSSSNATGEETLIGGHGRFVPKNTSASFHERVTRFFGDDCEVRFFMTWISSVPSFGPREMSAIESVFRAHPRGCLLMLSKAMDSPEGYLLLKQFLDRDFRIGAVTPDLAFLLEDIPPAKAWLEDINSGKRSPGKIKLGQNLSNLMRLAILYKYGGVYADTDFLVLKSFQGLRNVIGEQVVGKDAKRWPRLNNAVLVFDRSHSLLLEFIVEFADHFNGNIWGHNGPGLLTRVVNRLKESSEHNFTVLPLRAFYPVHWGKIHELYQAPRFENETKRVEDKVEQLRRESYGIHLWNSVSREFPIEEGSVIQKLVAAE